MVSEVRLLTISLQIVNYLSTSQVHNLKKNVCEPERRQTTFPIVLHYSFIFASFLINCQFSGQRLYYLLFIMLIKSVNAI